MTVSLQISSGQPCGASQPPSFPCSTGRPQWPLWGCCSMVTHASMLVSSNRLCLWTHQIISVASRLQWLSCLPLPPPPKVSTHLAPNPHLVKCTCPSDLASNSTSETPLGVTLISHLKASTTPIRLAITLFTHYMTLFIFELPCCSVSSKSVCVLSCSVETAFSHHFSSEPPPAPCSKPDPH